MGLWAGCHSTCLINYLPVPPPLECWFSHHQVVWVLDLLLLLLVVVVGMLVLLVVLCRWMDGWMDGHFVVYTC